MRGRVGAAEDRPVLGPRTPPRVGSRWPEEAAIAGQARQDVDPEVGLHQLGDVVVAVQQQQRAGCVGRPRRLRRAQLAMASVVAVPACGPRRPTASGSTQLPVASGIAASHWYSQAPMIPLCGVPAVTKRPQVRSGLVLASGRGQVVPSTTHSRRASTRAGGIVWAKRRRNAATSSEPSASASQIAGPAAAKARRQRVAHQAAGTVATEHGVEQVAQRIAAQAEHALVEFGAKARQRGGRCGSHAADYPQPGALSLSVSSFVTV